MVVFMRVAVVGSRTATQKDYAALVAHIPANASEIVSGGAQGVDTLARQYAKEHRLILTEFLPDYEAETENPRAAPLLRNQKIVDYADYIIAFWDGRSKGTRYTIQYAHKQNKPVKLVLLKAGTCGERQI